MAGGSLAPGQAAPSPSHRKRKATTPATVEDEGAGVAEEEEDIEELERELVDLDCRILEHRRGAAKRFLDTAASHLAALRPPEALDDPAVSESSIAEDDPGKHEKLMLIKSKLEANISALPKVIEKINQSMAQCEKLENLDVNIHPVFRRKW